MRICLSAVSTTVLALALGSVSASAMASPVQGTFDDSEAQNATSAQQTAPIVIKKIDSNAPAPPVREDDSYVADITVNAYTVDLADKALQACLERNCPPDEDIAASIALANAQFLVGQYRDSRLTLFGSKGRNKKHAKDYPAPVSQLYSAEATIALHLGYSRDHERAARLSRDILRDYSPEDNARLWISEMRLADARLTRGEWRSALRIFASVRDKAAQAGNFEIAASADIRRLAIELARVQRLNDKQEDVRNITQAASQYASDDRLSAPVQRVALGIAQRAAETLSEAYDTSETDIPFAVAPALTAQGQPILIHPEKFSVSSLFTSRQVNGDGEVTRLGIFLDENRNAATGISFEGIWADFAFLINPDGSVGEVSVAQNEGYGYWHKKAREAIATRVYAPLPAFEDGKPRAMYITERWTFTSRYLDGDGTNWFPSRIQRRSPSPSIEKIQIAFEDVDAD